MCADEDTPAESEEQRAGRGPVGRVLGQAGHPARRTELAAPWGAGPGRGNPCDGGAAGVRGGGRSGCFHYSVKEEASGEDGKGGVGV